MNDFTNLYSFHNASNQLEFFIKTKAANYSKMRNFDLGSLEKNFVSGLSPAITRRIISEDHVVQKVLQSFSFNAVEKYIQEICWRTYWKGYLEHRPQIWKSYLSDLETLDHVKDQRFYSNAINGMTAIECFNDWCYELKQNNYLHNHTRMWFASIWIYTLNLPWQLGAEFFMNNLFDADPASNTLSWRWVAGLHTKNKQYFASADNIKKYTNNKYYPKGQIGNKNSRFLDWESFDPVDLDTKRLLPEKKLKYLLIHENDLNIRDLPRSDFLFLQKKSINSTKRADLVNIFVDKALESFEQNINKEKYKEIVLFDFNEIEKIKACLDQNGQGSIYSPYPTVGFLNDTFKKIERKEGIRFKFFNSNWDMLFWPHAKRGFFKLKTQIKSIINDLKHPSFNF